MNDRIKSIFIKYRIKQWLISIKLGGYYKVIDKLNSVERRQTPFCEVYPNYILYPRTKVYMSDTQIKIVVTYLQKHLKSSLLGNIDEPIMIVFNKWDPVNQWVHYEIKPS